MYYVFKLAISLFFHEKKPNLEAEALQSKEKQVLLKNFLHIFVHQVLETVCFIIWRQNIVTCNMGSI